MIMEIMQQNNFKPGRRTMKIANKYIAENGGSEMFKSVYKKQKETNKNLRPAPEVPNRASGAVRAAPRPPSLSTVPPPPVPPPPPPPPPSFGGPIPLQRNQGFAPPTPPDPVDSLLKSITNFNTNALKSVDKQSPTKEKPVEGDIVNGLVDALIRMRVHMSKLYFFTH